MKSTFHLRILSLAIVFAFFSSAVLAAEYYVVIGSFAHESNAKRFTTTVRNFFKDVSYSYNESRDLYYVTALRTSRKEDARNWALYLKNEKGFTGAWVFTQNAEGDQSGTLLASSRSPRMSSPEIAFYSASPSAETSEHHAGSVTMEHLEASNLESAWTFSDNVGFIRNVANASAFGKTQTDLFTFKVEDEKGNSLPSEVMLVNFAKRKKIAAFQVGEKVAIKSTKPEQIITFVCDRLGYSQETRMFNLDHLSRSKDIFKNSDGVWEVRIKLKRMQMHEIAPLNKTLFYKDAAVLEPASEEELDELVKIMKSNLGYRIVLHSHCNPGAKRDIKLAEDEKYFDLDAAVEKQGSDKLLTKKRAEIVKDYLVNHGIDKKRVQIVAWGSLEPIVSSTSSEAQINDRLEIELVD